MLAATDMKPDASKSREIGSRGPRPIDNAPMAILAAAAVGAMGCSIQFMLMTGGLTGAGASISTVFWSGLVVFGLAWLIAAFVFFIGLLFVGLPVWAGLERLGWMSPGASVVAGGALGALAAGLFGGPPFAVFLLLPGAAAGWMLHRVAYVGRLW